MFSEAALATLPKFGLKNFFGGPQKGSSKGGVYKLRGVSEKPTACIVGSKTMKLVLLGRACRVDLNPDVASMFYLNLDMASMFYLNLGVASKYT